jgi:hypothetical protein
MPKRSENGCLERAVLDMIQKVGMSPQFPSEISQPLGLSFSSGEQPFRPQTDTLPGTGRKEKLR